jgi:hypothetical protein
LNESTAGRPDNSRTVAPTPNKNLAARNGSEVFCLLRQDFAAQSEYNNAMLATAEKLTKLTTVSNEQEAAILVATLQVAGIDACHMGETTANFRVGVPGQVHVFVAEKEFERAQHVFAEEEALQNTKSLEDDESGRTSSWGWKVLVLLVLFLLLLTGGGGTRF